MRSYPNIESRKLMPHHNYYVGYAPLSGVWRIRKTGKAWYALCNNPQVCADTLFADNLREMSDKLSSK